jgi:hypothetical protein
MASPTPRDNPDNPKNNIVTIRFEPIWKGQKRLMWLATTQDGETALLLRSTFLPGQQGEVERERQKAFMRGFMAAIA